MTTNGTLTTLANLIITNGTAPAAGLTLGPDGNLYGTTSSGGGGGAGTIFQVSANGSFTTLVNFTRTNGADPNGALAVGPDGDFYGTTLYGGNLSINGGGGFGNGVQGYDQWHIDDAGQL